MNKLLLAGMLLIAASSCKYDNPETLRPDYHIKVNVAHKVGSTPFVPHSSFTNPFGEIYVLDKFNYYFTNIEVLQNGSSIGAKETESYHLVEAGSPTSESFTISVPATDLNGVSFMIGVDSARNISGAQTGALDPLNGMFWTWNTGYIMVKMEGTSPLSTNPGNKFEYHIGGFKLPYNNVRKVKLNFPPGKKINISENGTAEIFITCDIGKWFNGQHNFKIAENPFSIHTVIPVTEKVADNYATMFTVTDIINH